MTISWQQARRMSTDETAALLAAATASHRRSSILPPPSPPSPSSLSPVPPSPSLTAAAYNTLTTSTSTSSSRTFPDSNGNPLQSLHDSQSDAGLPITELINNFFVGQSSWTRQQYAFWSWSRLQLWLCHRPFWSWHSSFQDYKKLSWCWQTCAMRWRSVKVTIPYVRYSFLLCNSNFVFRTRRFYDIQLQKMSWPWN